MGDGTIYDLFRKQGEKNYKYFNVEKNKELSYLEEGNQKNFYNKLIGHENKKIKALTLYPPFNKKIKLIREQFNIPCGGFNINNSNNIDDLFVSGLLDYRYSYEDMIKSNKDFFKYIKSLLDLMGIRHSITSYIFISFYTIFERIPNMDELEKLDEGIYKIFDIEETNNIPNTVSKKDLINIFNNKINQLYHYIKESGEESKFENSIMRIRRFLGIKANDSINNIVYNYNKFYDYLIEYGYFKYNNDFISVMYSLMNEYKYLNCNSSIDYQLLFNYILFGTEMDFKKDLKEDIFGTEKVQVYTSTDIIKNDTLRQENLYLKLPIYINKQYMETVANKVISEAYQYYGLIFIKDISINYYRDKYLFELKNLYKTNSYAKIKEKLSQDVADGYLKKEDFNDLYLILEGEKSVRSKEERLKDLIKEYRGLEEKYKSGVIR